MIGRVVSTKMIKTVVVLVESKKTHPVYGKSYTWTKKYLVDDQTGVSEGDVVIFEKIKPISKNKHWRINKILGRDFVSLEQAELAEDAAQAIAEVLPEEKKEVEIVVEEKQEQLKEDKVEKPSKVAKAKATKKKEEK